MAGVVHISEEEAARDFAALMKHVRSGDEVLLDCKDGVRAVVKRANDDEPVSARSIDAIIEGLKERKERQRLAMIDADFDADFEPDAAEASDTPRIHTGPLNHAPFERRTISEAIEILRRLEETEELAVPDPDFAADMEEIHAIYNQPMDTSKWD